MQRALTIDSPIGPLQLVAVDEGLSHIHFGGSHDSGIASGNDGVLSRAKAQLEEYFSGLRKTFDLPLAASGTAFQQAVWQGLQDIPWGETRSYAELARGIDRPRAVRAVGAANGRNPLPIVVPCHRVIGSDGSLTGFAGGLERKRVLLELEGIAVGR
jgi:methylated-DNA-[protein]-cysteine S-methyltransferase